MYAAARSSSVTSKGFEYLSQANERASSAYRAAAQNALVASIASKGGDLVDKGRVKLAAKLVELRFFAGLDMASVAASLSVSRRTAERDWTLARAWLRRELCDD